MHWESLCRLRIGKQRVLETIFVAIALSGCGDNRVLGELPDASSTGPDAPTSIVYTLTQGSDITLADGTTHLVFKTIHTINDFAGLVVDGLPYVSVDDGWLELFGTATIASAGYIFKLTLVGCKGEQVSVEDYVFTALVSCKVEVTTSLGSPPTAAVVDETTNVALNDRYAARAVADSAQLIVVRSLGFSIDQVARTEPIWTVTAASASLDVVTNFGVANLDIAHAMPIIGHHQDVRAGSQPLRVVVTDIGNINTHCAPPPEGCKNVFDLRLDLQGTSGPVRILDYGAKPPR